MSFRYRLSKREKELVHARAKIRRIHEEHVVELMVLKKTHKSQDKELERTHKELASDLIALRSEMKELKSQPLLRVKDMIKKVFFCDYS